MSTTSSQFFSWANCHSGQDYPVHPGSSVSSFQFSRAHSATDAVRRLNSNLGTPCFSILATRPLRSFWRPEAPRRSGFHPRCSPATYFRSPIPEAAVQAGAAPPRPRRPHVASLQHALVTAINTETLRNSSRKAGLHVISIETILDRLPATALDAISHAVKQSLCVITPTPTSSPTSSTPPTTPLAAYPNQKSRQKRLRPDPLLKTP